MSEHLRDLASLQVHYEDVIQTHRDLAVVFSSLIPTIVDGRLPGHDLAAMLKNLAEREELMAMNWGFVRDGLIDKLRSDIHEWTIEVATEVDSDEADADADKNSESDLPMEEIEERRRTLRFEESSIANHLPNAMANAVKSGPENVLQVRSSGIPGDVARREDPNQTVFEHAAGSTKRNRLAKEERRARKQHHAAKKASKKKQKTAAQSRQDEYFPYQKFMPKNAYTGTHVRHPASRVWRNPAQQLKSKVINSTEPKGKPEHLRLKRVENERLERERALVAEWNAREEVRKSTAVFEQHPRLNPGLVRALDGRVIKQESED